MIRQFLVCTTMPNRALVGATTTKAPRTTECPHNRDGSNDTPFSKWDRFLSPNVPICATKDAAGIHPNSTHTAHNNTMEAPAKLGPDPILISRSQVEALYVLLRRTADALDSLRVEWIITGGSLLGAVRQHSILFTDDDVDIAIIGNGYERVKESLQQMLGSDFTFTANAWEGGDRVRWKKASNVFLDLFQIQMYENETSLRQALSQKANGQSQPNSYVVALLQKIHTAAHAQGEDAPLYPCWQFAKRKAIELWPKEVYRYHELFPVQRSYKMGPVTNLPGPHMPLLLLKRAFGSDCFDVYYQSQSHHFPSSNALLLHPNDQPLPPRVQPGGLWENSPKVPLRPEHYIPTQPLVRAKRRATFHDMNALMAYLDKQTLSEARIQASLTTRNEQNNVRPRRTVYMDGVFDLFHIGHLRAIEQCKDLGDTVIIGVTGDADAADYKRPPVISQEHRIAVVAALAGVDKVICPCPLIVTEEFMRDNDIDLVVHGFANDNDAERQYEFFRIPMEIEKFQRIQYCPLLSTSDIIQKILLDTERSNPTDAKSNPKWFSSAIVDASNRATDIVFSDKLRDRMEPFIRTAAQRRSEILAACGYVSQVCQEADFGYNTSEHRLREALLVAGNLPSGFDLTQLHQENDAKDQMMRSLTTNWRDFQTLFTTFVLRVCAPQFSDSYDSLYFQTFPCLRVIQPDEFSIGPHADVAYGHHPSSINFYIPITPIWGTASLFLESQVGKEDWHPIIGNFGTLKRFAGGSCLHFTPRNTTSYTRVSLDFRLIPGVAFESMRCTTKSGEELDNQLRQPGYYRKCYLRNGDWELESSESPRPDARMGFPWTVQDWDKYERKRRNKQETKS